MKHTIKRLFALILALAMCLSLFSANVWAAEPLEDSSVSAQSSEDVAPEAESEDRSTETPDNEDETHEETQSESVSQTEEATDSEEAVPSDETPDEDESTEHSASLETQSTGGHTQAEAVAWARNQVGSTYAGSYGYQCVDLVREYYAYLGQARPTGNANDYLNDRNGHKPSGWSIHYGSAGIQPGDVFVWTGGGYGHVAIVVEVGSNSCTVMEQNRDGKGDQRTEASKGHYGTWSFANTSGYIRPDFVDPSHPTAQLSINRRYYNPGDTVTFVFSGQNTTGTYTLGIYKELDRYKTIDVNSNSYSIQFNEVASYSAYMTSYGTSGGLADSNWVDWQVLPLSAELSVDKTQCNVNDNVTLTFGGNNNNIFSNGTVTLAVWRDGEYVVHKDVENSSYTVTCDQPGRYSSYMTAYGGGTYKDSNWVYWQVLPLSSVCKTHTWDDGTFTKKPTYTEEGERTFTCTVCHATRTEAIPKLTETEATTEPVPEKQDNSITANDVVKSYSTKKQTVKLNASANGAPLNYKTSNRKVTVDKTGKVTITAKFSGKAKITITAAETDGYKAATKTIAVIVPTVPGNLKTTAGKGQMTVSWKKNTTGKGYEVQYSSDKKFKKGNKTVKIGKNATVKTTIKNLKKGTYYVRIRTVNGKNSSDWSNARIVKIKK